MLLKNPPNYTFEFFVIHVWRMTSIRVSSLLTQPLQVEIYHCHCCIHSLTNTTIWLCEMSFNKNWIYISKSFISSHPSIIQTDLGESYNYLQSLKSTSLCSDQTMKTWCDIFWCLSHSYVFFYINRLSSCQRTRLT